VLIYIYSNRHKDIQNIDLNIFFLLKIAKRYLIEKQSFITISTTKYTISAMNKH